MAARTRRTKGFTLVEMLVVITIIGTLAAILLPAVQGAREAARSLQCRANLENLAAATDIYESAMTQYPGYQNTLGATRTKGSWTMALLPHLDAGPVFDALTDSDPNNDRYVYLEVLNCPSDVSQAEGNFPSLSYVANAGWAGNINASGGYSESDSIHDGIFVDRFDDATNTVDNRKPNLNKDTVGNNDGTQFTLLFSENLHEARQPTSLNNRANTWAAFEQPAYDVEKLGTPDALAPKRYTVFVWHGTANPFRVINGEKYNELARVDNSSTDAARPSAFHVGGVNVVFAASNSFFMRETIDYRVYQQLCTTNDKKSHIPGAAGLPPLSDADFQ